MSDVDFIDREDRPLKDPYASEEQLKENQKKLAEQQKADLAKIEENNKLRRFADWAKRPRPVQQPQTNAPETTEKVS